MKLKENMKTHIFSFKKFHWNISFTFKVKYVHTSKWFPLLSNGKVPCVNSRDSMASDWKINRMPSLQILLAAAVTLILLHFQVAIYY